MIISGNPDTEKAWEAVYSEYCELSQDKTTEYILSLAKNIEITQNNLILIQAIIDQLSVKRNERLIKMLQTDFGFRLTYSDLDRDLPRTVTQAKTQLLSLKKLQADYAKVCKEGKEQPATEKSYMGTLQALSKMQGYQVKAKEISVTEYIVLLEDFNRQIKPNGRE